MPSAWTRWTGASRPVTSTSREHAMTRRLWDPARLVRIAAGLSLLVPLLTASCSKDDSGDGQSQGAADSGRADLRPGRSDAIDDDAERPDAPGDAADLGDAAPADGIPADDPIPEPVTTDSDSPDAESDSDADTGPIEGPDNPTVECLTDDTCPSEGEEIGVCCTEPLLYYSRCLAESACTPGEQDACLTDEQCAARRPGQWTVCCHDRGSRDYCAPLIETCQPLVPCDEVADCASQTTDTCCSYHEYYQRSYCTNSFFALNPDRDCP